MAFAQGNGCGGSGGRGGCSSGAGEHARAAEESGGGSAGGVAAAAHAGAARPPPEGAHPVVCVGTPSLVAGHAGRTSVYLLRQYHQLLR